jgi:hypothetical protein
MADQRIQYNEQLVGAGHPAKTDTVNRLSLVEHNNDGTHKYEFAIDVRKYGAVGDGVTDDTAAIVAAIASIPATGGELRLIPGATHLITCPTASTFAGGTIYTAFTMKSNLKVAGWNSAFKVADNVSTDAAPKNISVFFSNQYLENISFEGVIFDLNGANNHTNASNYQMSAIMFSSDNARCDDLRIRNCRFLDYQGTSVIILAQSSAAGSLMGQRNIVANNYFYTAWLDVSDHSTIFGRVENSVFLNNTFEFSAYRGDDVGVAAEIQGQGNRFVFNKVLRYGQGLWVTTNFTNITQDVIILGNVMNVKNLGVDFWHEAASEIGLSRTVISENTVELDDTATSLGQKVGFQVASRYSNTDILIRGNIVNKTGNVVRSAGVSFVSNLAGQKHENIVVDGNLFSNLYIGVASNNSLGGIGTLKVINNTFRNLVNLTAAELSATGVLVYANSVTVDDLIVQNNSFVNDSGGSWPYGLWLGAAGTGVIGNITVDGNHYRGMSTVGPVSWLSYTESGLTAAATKRFGREPLYMTTAPTTGTWSAGQRVYNSAPAVGQPKSWVCTVAGNPGTWVSEGNL